MPGKTAKTPAREWPADKVERRPVADLVPYARNARTHSEAQVAQIAASIEEFGWTIPALIDEAGGLIAGHGRVLAAKELGILEIPVMVARGQTDAQKRAYVLADNQLALNAGWDEDLLRLELGDLGEAGVDLGLIGFDDETLARLLPDGDDDEADEPEPGSGKGNLAERFGVPPFTVLSARDGWWQDRKRAWIGLGIQSELGRGEQLIPNGGGHGQQGPIREGAR